MVTWTPFCGQGVRHAEVRVRVQNVTRSRVKGHHRYIQHGRREASIVTNLLPTPVDHVDVRLQGIEDGIVRGTRASDMAADVVKHMTHDGLHAHAERVKVGRRHGDGDVDLGRQFHRRHEFADEAGIPRGAAAEGMILHTRPSPITTEIVWLPDDRLGEVGHISCEVIIRKGYRAINFLYKVYKERVNIHKHEQTRHEANVIELPRSQCFTHVTFLYDREINRKLTIEYTVCYVLQSLCTMLNKQSGP